MFWEESLLFSVGKTSLHVHYLVLDIPQLEPIYPQFEHDRFNSKTIVCSDIRTPTRIYFKRFANSIEHIHLLQIPN